MEDKINELTDINYDVFNGLNLINEDLGQSYLDNGFNPLGDDFVLDDDFVIEQFENDKTSVEIPTPDFILQGDKATRLAFETSIENCLALLESLYNTLNDPQVPEALKAEIKKLIVYILCRNEMLRLYIIKLKKDKEKNALKMHEMAVRANLELGKILEETFKPNFNRALVYSSVLSLAETRSHRAHKRDMAIIAKAEEIIKHNSAKLQQKVEDAVQKIEDTAKKVQDTVQKVGETAKKIVTPTPQTKKTSTRISTSSPRTKNIYDGRGR